MPERSSQQRLRINWWIPASPSLSVVKITSLEDEGELPKVAYP
jgi:hypothetical protein